MLNLATDTTRRLGKKRRCRKLKAEKRTQTYSITMTAKIKYSTVEFSEVECDKKNAITYQQL